MDSELVNCKIITYFGKNYEISMSKEATIGQLKQQIQSLDEDVPEYKLIYAGRVLKKENIPLSEILIDNNPTFFVNAAEVHGGCHCIEQE